MNGGFVTGSAFNRFVNLDNIEYKIVDFLAKSESKYANYLWKILKYDSVDCLSKENLTYTEKMQLLYKDNGDSTPFRVFLTPYTDDAWVEQSSHLHIYVSGLNPTDHIVGVVQVTFELITHNKIPTVLGDASEFNPSTNKVELENGEPVILYKSRASEMLKDTVAALNGQMVNGVGVLQFNQKQSIQDVAKASVWNGRKFFGYTLTMSTMLSGVSENSNCGY